MKFTKEHEWVVVNGGVATVGISDYAQGALGDVVSVELPKVGVQVQQSKNLAIVDSMKASSEVYAPVSGTVVEVNAELASHPEYINSSPYDKGWMAKVKLSNPKELDALMDKTAYDAYTKGLKH